VYPSGTTRSGQRAVIRAPGVAGPRRRVTLAGGGARLASDDLIEIEGIIKEVFPGGHFLVETDAGTEVNAHLAGKLRRYRIRVVLGDKVTVAVSPYDLTKGRIVFRHK
jgi:translation initiation factor IF-1